MAAVAVPAESRISRETAGAYFCDAFEVALRPNEQTALELYLSAVRTTPRWIESMMALRNRVVALFGLKNLGAMSAVDRDRDPASYRVGDRVGIFNILSLSPNEVILGDADKHLRAQISVYKRSGAEPKLVATTVVHVHNLLGRVYLFFVVPVHKLIVPAMLARTEHALRRP